MLAKDKEYGKDMRVGITTNGETLDYSMRVES